MDNRAIGVFDSGLGGLTVVKELMSCLPAESVIYFGDTGRVPYGTRPEETIVKYVKQDIKFLLGFDIKMIIAACGTASAVALHRLDCDYGVSILGVVEPAAQAAVRATRNKRVGVIGTTATINSGLHEKLIKSLDPDITVAAQACPLLVPLVENGHTSSSAVRLIAQEYLLPLKTAKVDTIILGCTHYPLLRDVIYDIMGAGVFLIDSGAEAARHVKKILSENNMLAQGEATCRYFVSDGAVQFSHLAGLFLERNIECEAERALLDE